MSGRDKPVLVTGGTGFIGSYVVRALLDNGRNVRLFDTSGLSPEARFVLGHDADRLPIDQGSIDDAVRFMDVVKGCCPGAIVHIAGIVDPLFLLTNPTVALHVNVVGTVNMLEAARVCAVERVVYVSSIGVLPTAQYQPIDAAHPIVLPTEGPASGAYGASKVAGEVFGFAYHQAFGLDFRVIRPSAAYGFGMKWHSSNYMKQFVEPAVRGETVCLASGGSLPRDYTHVVDVARLALAVLDAPPGADRVFYAATGEPLVTAAEVAQMVREVIPGADLQIADVLSDEDRLELGFRGVLSIETARRQLGWTPLYPSVRDGIADYIARYRAFLAR